MIDKNKLRELALDPANRVKEISAALGMAEPTFYSALAGDPEAKKIYQDARDQMRAARPENGGDGSPRKRSERKPRPGNTPPQHGSTNGKGRVSEQLLRKIAHEFEHIKIYEEISERFDDVAAELGKAL